MNPPEKIFLTSEDVKILGLNKDVVAPIGNDIETFEYHLALVWHDAKTDPPKESNGKQCAVIWQGAGDIHYDTAFYSGGFGWQGKHGVILGVIWYMPLPEPPKDEWGRTDAYPYGYQANYSTYIPEPPKESEVDLCDCGEPFPENGYCKFCGTHRREGE